MKRCLAGATVASMHSEIQLTTEVVTHPTGLSSTRTVELWLQPK